jgi:hypothetical protein
VENSKKPKLKSPELLKKVWGFLFFTPPLKINVLSLWSEKNKTSSLK